MVKLFFISQCNNKIHIQTINKPDKIFCYIWQKRAHFYKIQRALEINMININNLMQVKIHGEFIMVTNTTCLKYISIKKKTKIEIWYHIFLCQID